MDFDSGLVVMDIRGGRPIKRDTTSPGEVLLMDDGGNLILRDELDDEAAYAHSKPPEEPDEAGKAGVTSIAISSKQRRLSSTSLSIMKRLFLNFRSKSAGTASAS